MERSTTKLIVGIVSSISVNALLHNVVKANLPGNLNIVTKVAAFVGEAILIGVAAEAGTNYVMDTIDEVNEAVKAVQIQN